MKTKNQERSLREKVLRKLPFTSMLYVFRDSCSESFPKYFLKMIGHTAYATTLAIFLGFSISTGTFDVSKWPEIFEERRDAIEEYFNLRREAYACVDEDGIEGLTTFKEIEEFYSRAEIPVSVSANQINIPRPSGQDLERVVESCR